MSKADSAFDLATDSDTEVNKLLAETGGKIAAMEYSGAVGYHVHAAY